jgi:hypothetical protein
MVQFGDARATLERSVDYVGSMAIGDSRNHWLVRVIWTRDVCP